MIPALGKPEAAERLPTLPRGVLRPWSVLPGTWQTPEEVLEHGVLAPLACPRPASSQWQTLFKGRTETQGLPVGACEARPQAPHRPSGCPSSQLSLCPASERLMKRPSPDRTRAG